MNHDPRSLDKVAAVKGRGAASNREGRFESSRGEVFDDGHVVHRPSDLDRSGKRKRVRYWAMTVAGGDPAGDNEVDEAIWVPLPEARARLSYSRDTIVLDALADETGR